MPEDLPAGPAQTLDLKSISRAALVTALAIVFPPVFHALKLGSIFLPMYLPVLAGAFFISPGWAVVAGFSAPLISTALTGMPPVFPPIALWLAAELAVAGAVVSTLSSRFQAHPFVAVICGLAAARATQAALVFLTARFLDLPPTFLTLGFFIAAWPGIVLAVTAVPAAVSLARRKE